MMKKLFTRKKKRVLVVDDNSELADNIKDFLENDNFFVKTAKNGQEAISKCKNNKFDLVLMDLKLPDTNGIELIDELKEISPKLEFIIITGHATLETSLPSVGEKKIISYQEKPLQLSNLKLTVDQFFKRKKDEKESEFKSRLLEYTSDLIIVTDIKANILYTNESVGKTFGKDVNDYIGKNVFDLADSLQFDINKEDLLQKVKGDGFWRGNIKKINEDKSEIVLDCRLHLIKYEQGKPLGFLAILTDITDQYQTRLELKDVNKRLSTILDNMAEMIFIIDKEGKYIDFYANKEDDLAIPSDEIVGKFLPDAGFDQEKVQIIKQKIDETLSTGKSKRLEYKLQIGKDNNFYEAQMVPFGEDKVLATVRNITDRVEAEKNFRNLFHSTADAIFINERHGDILYANEAACKQTGYSQEELINMNVTKDLNAAGPLETTFEEINQKIKQEDSVKFVEKKRKKDGSEYWTEVVITPIDFQGKKVTMSINRDITKRIEAERQLQESEEKFRMFLNASADWTFLKDENLRYLMINNAYLNFIGKKRREVIGKTDEDLLPKDLARQCEASDKDAIEKNEPIMVEEKHNNKIYESRKFPVELSENKVGVGGFIREVTLQKKAQRTAKVLYEISHLAHGTDNVRNLITKIGEYLGEIIDTKNFYVAMYDAESDVITLPYIQDSKDVIETFPAGKTLTKYVIDTGESQYITEEKAKELEEQGKVEQYGSRSKIWVGVPLKIENEIIGVMAVQNYENADTYSKDDIKLLEIAADEIAHTIHHQEDDRKLKESEERYRKLINSSHDAIMVLEPPQWQFVSANPSAEKMFQMTEDEIINTTPIDLSPLQQPDGEKTEEKAKTNLKKAMENGNNFFEWQHQRADGTIFPATVLLTKVELKEKSFLQATVRDITEQKQAEKELENQKEYFQSLFRGSPEAIVSLDENNAIRGINSEFEDLFGYHLSEIEGKDIDELIVPQEYSQEADKLTTEVAKGKYVKKETIRMAKDGTIFPVSIWASPITVNGRRVGIYAIYRDISERRIAEEKLQESEEKYRRIFETSRDAIYRTTPDGKFLDMNDAGIEMFGYSEEELFDLDVKELYYNAKERDRFGKKIKKEGFVKDYEVALKNKQGEKLYCLISATISKNDKGKITSFEGIIKDITERKKAELALKKEQKRYKELSEELKIASITDELTGVANRRYFNTHIENEWYRAVREKAPLSLMIFDVDYFKTYNDTFGHLEGDKCLQKIAKALKDIFKRPGDLFARYGGDEFAAILPNTNQNGVIFLAKECCRSIELLDIKNEKSPIHDLVTVTAGCASLKPDVGERSERLIKLADKALYQAKEKGRNGFEYKGDSV